MQTKKYYDQTVAVLGFGRSGRAATDFLLDRVARLTVYAPEPPEGAEEYRKRGVDFCIGPFPHCFDEALLVRSPGIRPDHPAILASLAAGATLTSETELLFDRCRAKIIGITGSDGKTTTAALTAALLRGAGRRVFLGGNNGVPLLPQVDEMTAEDLAVVELSSFQLMTAHRVPHIGVITNITPNHLNWHADMSEYIAAKCRIFDKRTAFLVTNADCAITQSLAQSMGLPRALFSSKGSLPEDCEMSLTVRDGLLWMDLEGGEARCSLEAFRLPGRHNLENLMAALAAATAALGQVPALDGLADFHGVSHRLEFIDTVRGVNYINSSIDTSPTRTVAALAALQGRPIVILGGRGKGISFAPLKKALERYAKTAFLYGEAAHEIATAVGDAIPTHRYSDFADAFRAAAQCARTGDTVLLSPACTAFDQFRDFEARGEAFCALVQGLKHP